MKNIAKRPAEDREALFRNTADKMGINEAIIEKDFWVCWMLNHLFHDCPWKNTLTFKGGTSLSKAYGLIDRFSEDIDLIIDWCILDYDKDEPWKDRTKNQQDHFNKEANHRAEEFLKDIFLPQITNDLSEAGWRRSRRPQRSKAERSEDLRPDAVEISCLPLLLPRGEPSCTPSVVYRPPSPPPCASGSDAERGRPQLSKFTEETCECPEGAKPSRTPAVVLRPSEGRRPESDSKSTDLRTPLPG